MTIKFINKVKKLTDDMRDYAKNISRNSDMISDLVDKFKHTNDEQERGDIIDEIDSLNGDLNDWQGKIDDLAIDMYNALYEERD